jgi:hypothetical protein
MQIEVFTEDSGTTAEKANVEEVEDFFRGGFLPIKDLSSELASYGDISVHILSEEYGYLKGSDPTNELSTSDEESTDAVRRFSEEISEASRTADVIVILLTKSVFEETVMEKWDTLVSNTKSDPIWCIGASRSAVSPVNIEKLRSEAGAVIVYERVGVARISNEHKDELIETVHHASTE